MTAPEYADELVKAISARVLAVSGPVNEALIREAALPLIRRVIEDCAHITETKVSTHDAVWHIRKMKG